MRSVAIVMMMAFWSAADAALPAPPKRDVIYTRQQVFRIPFDIEPSQDGRRQPQEVELHVSDNHGQQWHLAKVVPPQAQGFVFRAPRDGEYWFVVRTIDGMGNRLPAAVDEQGRPLPTVPEMKVVVDTQLPQLDLRVMRGYAGEILIQWRCGDHHLAANKPNIEYRELGPQPGAWQQVAVGGLQGQATLHAPPVPVAIRARIGDRAENVTVRALQIDPAGRVQPLNPDAVARNTPPTHPQSQPGGPQQQRFPRQQQPQEQHGPLGPRYQQQSQPPEQAPQEIDVFKRFQRNPADAQTSQQPQPPSGMASAEASRFETAAVSQPSIKPIMVNSSRFLLEYEIDAAGSHGLQSVALWGTTDGGQSWRKYGVDTDMQSPIEVNVPTEGLYGFKMNVEEGGGFGGSPPNRGEKPEIWVKVDTTPPVAQLKNVRNISGLAAEELHIDWDANDEELSNRPVSLFFAGSEGGPWYPIAEGLTNEGNFVWRLDDRIPRQLHIRLVVEDAAGNKTVVDKTEPVLADSKPKSRIRTARPFQRGRTRL